MPNAHLKEDSPACVVFVWISFVVAVTLMCVGIYWVPADAWVRGYFTMGLFFVVGSSLTLAKTLRDRHEALKIVNRLSEAHTEKILQEFEFK